MTLKKFMSRNWGFHVINCKYILFIVEYSIIILILNGDTMGVYIEDLIVHYIKKFREVTNDEENILRYGAKIIYYNLSKFVSVFLSAYILDIFSQVCTVFILVAIIRSFAFGFHAETFISCLLLTFINIFGIIYISSSVLNPLLKLFLCIISFILFFVYAPADTEERPLVDSQKRKKLKITVLLIWMLYVILAYYTNCQFYNMLLLSLFFMALNTCPILYILFRKEYKNCERI